MNNDQEAYMVFFDNGDVWHLRPDQPLSHGEIEARVKRTIRSLDCDGCIAEVVRQGKQPRVVNIIGTRVREDAGVTGGDETLPRAGRIATHNMEQCRGRRSRCDQTAY